MPSSAMADPCLQTMPMAKGDTVGCSGALLTPGHILRKALTCKTVSVPRLEADLELCKVKLQTHTDVSFLSPCADTHGPGSIRTHVLVGVLALTLGVIAGVALVPDFSMP